MAISETAQKNHDELFPGHVSTLKVTDPELIEMFDNFAFDEVLRHSGLDTRTRLMVQLAALDVTDTGAVRDVVDRSFRSLGRIDVVVSNAGYGLFGAAEGTVRRAGQPHYRHQPHRLYPAHPGLAAAPARPGRRADHPAPRKCQATPTPVSTEARPKALISCGSESVPYVTAGPTAPV